MASRTVNDPLYGDIRLYDNASQLIDTGPFQRLRKIKQLGFVHLVFPTATHTRFEHPLGAYHLSGLVLERMEERGELSEVSEEDRELIRLAALVHDTGHWPMAHVIEEYGYEQADHEKDGEAWITRGEIAEVLAKTGIERAAERIAEIIRHQGDHPLRTLVAGAVDVDRLDYLARDPYYCGIPRAMNQNRIIKYLTLRPDPVSGVPTVMVDEKGLVNLDQMMWQKFDLFRSVYWHRVVRSASAMGRSLLIQSIEAGVVTLDEVRTWSDDEFLFVLQNRLGKTGETLYPTLSRLLQRLNGRALYPTALTLPMNALPRLSAAERSQAEHELERFLGLERGGALLDIPHKKEMYDLDILIARRDGSAQPLREIGAEAGYLTQHSKDAMYLASGQVRVYTSEPRRLQESDLMTILQHVNRGAGQEAQPFPGTHSHA